MKKLLFLFLILFFIPVIASAQTARTVDVTISYDAPPAGEVITSYACEYKLSEDSVIGAAVDCSFAHDPVTLSHTLTLTNTTADVIIVKLAAINSNGQSTYTMDIIQNIPPAVDPASTPTGVTVTVVKQ